MATQMQRKKIAWPPERLVRKEKNNINNKVASFDVIFDVYTHVDNRERARETNFGGRKDENFIAAVRKWEMLAAR